ncbi:MAG: nucleotidyltransferase substrate binding protein [Alphaproteobacteria bacterium]|nr:nucleotidyltransferase substrate binding protein [Alphaproteobacteria bacterium]
MPLSAAALRNAVQRLREGLARHNAEPADEQLRDGLIQRFAFTYELSHKLLRRYLQQVLPSGEDAARMTFAELVRTGNEHGLLRAEWPAWRRFRDIRTRTTHTYDAGTAADVVREIPAFLDEAEQLCAAGAAARMTDGDAAVDLAPAQRRIVLDILRAHLPPGAQAWVFGSRAAGRARRYSDLDLAVDAGRRLTLDEAAILREAFDERDLPYRVDLVDWRAVGADFRRLIAGQRRQLHGGEEAGRAPR